MIKRHLYQNLLDWKNSSYRKPILLHGVRQVGKTTLIHELGKTYDQYLYFNLERNEDRKSFELINDLDKLIPQILLEKGYKDPKSISTLIFIDEVQEIPQVIEQMRYFYEDYPHIHLIVTGSLLAFGMDKVKRVPVGRIEYWYLFPVSFLEFLQLRNEAAYYKFKEIPVPDHLHSIFLKLFHEYVMVGGMPEVLQAYLDNESIADIQHMYQNINSAYFDDMEKYARNATEKDVLRAILTALPQAIDQRVNMNNFGNSGFKTREVKAAMRSLEKTGIIELKYPTTNTSPPDAQNTRKQPRLHFFDIGLMNSLKNIQSQYLGVDDLINIAKGAMIQQVVYQELKAHSDQLLRNFTFWVRDEAGASSEVDIVYPYRQLLIPVEIKSGAKGRLRSLHEFMDRCDHTYAIRLYASPLKIESMETRKGKVYQLLSMPYYLAGQIEEYMGWLIDKTAN